MVLEKPVVEFIKISSGDVVTYSCNLESSQRSSGGEDCVGDEGFMNNCTYYHYAMWNDTGTLVPE